MVDLMRDVIFLCAYGLLQGTACKKSLWVRLRLLCRVVDSVHANLLCHADSLFMLSCLCSVAATLKLLGIPDYVELSRRCDATAAELRHFHKDHHSTKSGDEGLVSMFRLFAKDKEVVGENARLTTLLASGDTRTSGVGHSQSVQTDEPSRKLWAKLCHNIVQCVSKSSEHAWVGSVYALIDVWSVLARLPVRAEGDLKIDGYVNVASSLECT